MRFSPYLGALVLLLLPGVVQAQTKTTYSGSLRLRQEAWDWFKPGTGSYQNAYTFTGFQFRYGVTQTTKTGESKLELQSTQLLGLPTRAASPAPLGALGLGATYKAANGNQTGSLFIKQAYFLDKKQGIRAGRFEFAEGNESIPETPSLAWVKKQRVSERLIAGFGWTHVGRAFDGIQYSKTSKTRTNLTGLLAYPTAGVFDLDGAKTLTDVRVAYLSTTKATKTEDKRLFAIAYEDVRKGITKSENSTTAEMGALKLYTLGGHYLATKPTKSGAWDFMGWAALQGGDWGTKTQNASAYSLEVGYKPKKAMWGAWYRLGYDVTSGDGNPADKTHGTFYAMLNTPRIYARTPFYTEANAKDIFFQVMAKPSPKLALRADYHSVSLASGKDLWYVAGGPFQSKPAFGLVGRKTNGSSALGDLLDISADYTLSKSATATLYLGQMLGKSVIQGIYGDKNGLLGYGELTYKF
ncbi:alginate export family protein [Armatimonas sp.]|uniref:alginate export family protein n=1 Tax=Armatimonas sp. TaxID=1872638 RepID=UPI0037530F5E